MHHDDPYAYADEVAARVGAGAERRRTAPGRASLTSRMPASAASIARAVARELARHGDGAVADDAETLVARAGGGGGSALPSALRSQFEGSLGVDLGGVRIHDDSAAASAAAAVGARAYATGQDVFFAAGEYRPGTAEGAHLLAHEVAHTVQQRGGSVERRHKLAVTTPGDAVEVEADRAADAMMRGRPFAVAGAPHALARFPPDGGMDAGVPAAGDPAPVRAEDVTSQVPASRDWFADARSRAGGVGTTQLRTAPPDAPRIDRVLHRDPAVQDAIDRLSTIYDGARRAVSEATPRFEQLPGNDPAIAGGFNRPMHDVVDPEGDAQPLSYSTSNAVRGQPTFMTAASTLRARGAALEAAGHHARATLDRNVAAQRRVEEVVARQRQATASAERAAAETARDDATRGRADELQSVQNAIRVLELGVGLLAGGVGAASAAGGASAATMTAGQATRVAATNATAGVASNSLHDLAVGWIAERFVSEGWERQINDANARIAAAARTVRDAGDQALVRALEAVQAEARAAAAEVSAANQALVAARHEYTAAHLAFAAAASQAAPGAAGRDAATHISAVTTCQARVAQLHELRDLLREPTAEDGATTRFGFPPWDAFTHRGGALIDTTARVLAMRTQVERDLALWEHRLGSLSAQVAHLARSG